MSSADLLHRLSSSCQASLVSDVETALRQRIFDLLDERARFGNGTMTTAELAAFNVDGRQMRLLANSKGIWNPRDLEATLSIVSSSDGPYADQEIAPGVWRYDYQARSDAGDNTKLRRAYETQTPIIMLRKISKGVYIPHFPVYVTHDNRAEHFFTVAVQEVVLLRDPDDVDGRRYVERVVQERIHQREFRGKVLLAYSDRCAICRLNHPELLDAAHILTDKHERGLPVVPNGLSLCKIHHSAFDANFLGIDGDYKVHINEELLQERDGPMLKHGLQEMHGARLVTPEQRTQKPDPDRLAERFAAFLAAS